MKYLEKKKENIVRKSDIAIFKNKNKTNLYY